MGLRWFLPQVFFGLVVEKKLKERKQSNSLASCNYNFYIIGSFTYDIKRICDGKKEEKK